MVELDTFFEEQTTKWELAAQNHEKLKEVELNSFSFHDFQVYVQHNPARILSTTAKTSTAPVYGEHCPLCEKYRNEQQKAIVYQNKYDIMVNPYPILEKHFTIAEKEHLKQGLKARLGDILALAHDLGGYTIIYNGPGAGASIPDHMHFQAVPQDILPVEREIKQVEKEELFNEDSNRLYSLKDYLRTCLVLESSSADWLIYFVEKKLWKEYASVMEFEGEWMLNAICFFKEGSWTLIFFPRKAHRPSQFFLGEGKILISPGTIDMSGMFITPRREDYNKMNKELIEEIYTQITL